MKIKKNAFLLLVLGSLASSVLVFAKQITIDIPDQELAIVENEVPDAVDWLKNAWKGKLEACKSRIVAAEIQASRSEQKVIPASDSELVTRYLRRPGYKNRKQRDAEMAKMEKEKEIARMERAKNLR